MKGRVVIAVYKILDTAIILNDIYPCMKFKVDTSDTRQTCGTGGRRHIPRW